MLFSCIDRRFILVIVSAALLSCSALPGPTGMVETTSSPPPPTTSIWRQGRYTLVELRPDLAQRDLQRQIVDLRIRATPDSTVGDALRYVLLRSGYQLCNGDTTLNTLFALPLPAAHLRLGPLELRQALQLLAGKPWRLTVDEQARLVCFVYPPDEPATKEQQS